MLKKIFRPKWQNKNSAIRINAVQDLQPSNPEELDILLQLGKDDPEESVRQAVANQFTDLTAIHKLSAENHTVLEPLLYARFVALISGQAGDLDTAQQRQAIENGSQQQLFDIAQTTQIAELQELAITLMTDQQLLSETVLASNSAKVRQLAMAGIMTPEALKATIRGLKNKDKRALQMAREKLNNLKDSRRADQQFAEEQEALCGEIEGLAKSAYNSQFSGKFLHLEKKWQTLLSKENSNKSDASILARVQLATNKCQATLQAFEEQEQEHQEEINKQQQLQQRQLEICNELEALQSKLANEFKPSDIESVENQVKQLQSEWRASCQSEGAQSHPKEQMRYNKVGQSLSALLKASQSLIKQLRTIEALKKDFSAHKIQPHFDQALKLQKSLQQTLGKIPWPEGINKPELLKELEGLSNQLQETLKSLEAQSKQLKQTLNKQLQELEQQLEAGAIDEAKNLANKVRNNLNKLSYKDRQTIESRARELQKQLNNLFDWQHYATDPKREVLCKEMEKLIETDIPPQQKAQSIKSLQDEWKNFGDSRHSQQLWQRFKQAADKAYIPCKAYFDQQDETRNNNQIQRQKICDSLSEYMEQTNWNSVDWKSAENIFNVAKQEWYQFNRVDRAKAKSQQKQFDALLDNLAGKLKTERIQNSERKEAIISKAHELLESEDIAAAIEEAKKLQQQWKSIGITYRKENQQLWNKFRGICDQVFENRALEKQTAQTDMENNLKLANEICSKIRKLAEQNDDSLSQSRAELGELKDEYSQLGLIPKSKTKTSSSNFKTSCDYYEQRFAGIRERSAQRIIALLEEFADLCNQLDALEADADTQRDDLQEQWHKPLELPAQWWENLDQRYQRSLEPANAELLNKNEQTLRTLCIQLEILANIESPAQDQAIRMEYQMARLSKGLGQDNQNQEQDMVNKIQDLQLQWYFTGPNPPKTFNALNQRFHNTLEQLQKNL